MKAKKILWITMLITVISMFTAIVSAEDEPLSMELPIPEHERQHPTEEVETEETTITKEKRKDGSHRSIIYHGDGSITYLTKGHAAVIDNTAFTWKKGTIEWGTACHLDKCYEYVIVDGQGITLKRQTT